jgi:hypothetical protein
MRCNPEYRSDYGKLQKRRKEIGYDRLTKQIEKDRFRWEKNHPTNLDNMADVEVDLNKCKDWLRTKRKKEIEVIESYEQEELEYSNKWSSGWCGKMYDPDKSFEEILNRMSNMKNTEEYYKVLLYSWAFQKGLNSGAVREIQYMTLPDGRAGFTNLLYIEPGDYFIKINFKKINSIGAVKKLVCDMIDAQYQLKRRLEHCYKVKHDDGTIELKHKEEIDDHPKRGQRYEVDYDLILKVGKLKEKGKTNEEVAKIFFPRTFKDSNDEIANPASKIRMISNYYKTYKKLVTGGYKKISST